MTTHRATLIGMLAILFWSFVIGLIREVSQHLGEYAGPALMYTLISIIMCFISGVPRFRTLSKSYLFWGGLFFIGTELCLSLSIAFAQSGRQTIEVGMINYLWPSFTILAAILFNKQHAKWWVVLGFALSFIGIAWVLGGEQGIRLESIVQNIQANPLSYGLALLDALCWAGYCTVTARLKSKQNAIALFFMLSGLVLWIKYLFATHQPPIVFDWVSVGYLIVTSFAIGLGYWVWNIGLLHGNVTLLAGASYFIPVFSAAVSSVLLETSLTASFWQGAILVVVGSMICWLATKPAKRG